MTVPDNKLPNSIRRWRRALDMTQTELATVLGVSPAIISYWERGAARPPQEHQLRLADALGVEPEALGIPEGGSPLRRLRRLRGLTQNELAEMAGVSDRQVSAWENGKNNPHDNGRITRLAAALGVEPGELRLRAYYGREKQRRNSNDSD